MPFRRGLQIVIRTHGPYSSRSLPAFALNHLPHLGWCCLPGFVVCTGLGMTALPAKHSISTLAPFDVCRGGTLLDSRHFLLPKSCHALVVYIQYVLCTYYIYVYIHPPHTHMPPTPSCPSKRRGAALLIRWHSEFHVQITCPIRNPSTPHLQRRCHPGSAGTPSSSRGCSQEMMRPGMPSTRASQGCCPCWGCG